jgi:hypothetical protein
MIMPGESKMIGRPVASSNAGPNQPSRPLRLHFEFTEIAGIEHPDPNARGPPLRLNQSLFDRKRSDSGQHVAAVRRRIDAALADDDLGKQIIDIGSLLVRHTDDGHLAGQRMRAADAVDLPLIGAHGRDQHSVALGSILRQISCMKVESLGAAATHQQTGNLHLHHRPRKTSAVILCHHCVG